MKINDNICFSAYCTYVCTKRAGNRPSSGHRHHACSSLLRQNKWCDSTKTKVTRDGMKKRYTLDVEEIGAKGHVEMVGSDGRRNGNGLELGNAGGSGTLRGSAFKVRDVGSVDDEGTGGIGGSNGAVAKVVTLENTLKIGFGGPAEETVKVAGSVGVPDLTGSEQFLLIGDSGDHGVMSNGEIRGVRAKDKKPGSMFVYRFFIPSLVTLVFVPSLLFLIARNLPSYPNFFLLFTPTPLVVFASAMFTPTTNSTVSEMTFCLLRSTLSPPPAMSVRSSVRSAP